MSIFSRSMTRLSQDTVGAMAVGRVSVAVIMYDTVPRSNLRIHCQYQSHQGVVVVVSSYINAAGKANVGKDELKAKFVAPRLEPTLASENLLILEEAGEAVAMVLRELRDAAARRYGGATSLGLGGGVFENVNIAVEGDDEMGDANGLDDGNVDVAADGVAGAICLMRLVGTDVKVEDVAIAGAYGKGGEVEAG